MLNKIFLLRFKLKFKPDETMKFTSPKNIISSDITFFSTFLLINTWMDGWMDNLHEKRQGNFQTSEINNYTKTNKQPLTKPRLFND